MIYHKFHVYVIHVSKLHIQSAVYQYLLFEIILNFIFT